MHQKPARTLDGIQILRGLAAIAVVAHHSIRAVAVHGRGEYGHSLFDIPWLYTSLAAGVDVFFVISGFIMVLVSAPYASGARPVRDFMAKRVARIYPPYLVATALVLLMAHGGHDFTPQRLLGALTLWPTQNSSGVIQPVLGVGWTLSYEMYFYGLFALSLLAFHRSFLVPLCIALVVACAVSNALPSTLTVVAFLQNPIVIEFLFGCLLGAAYVSDWLPRVPLAAAIGGLLLLFLSTAMLGETTYLRPLVWGIPSVLIVAACATSRWQAASLAGRFIVLLGDASFAIYLVHTLVIYRVIGSAWKRLAPLDASVDWAILAGVIAAIGAGIAFHFLVERPLRWRRRRVQSVTSL